MTKPNTFADLLANWPSHSDLRDDLGVTYQAAQKMRERSCVSAKHWPKLIPAAKKRGVRVTEADLMRMMAHHVGRATGAEQGQVA